MDIRNRRTLKNTASQCLEAASYNPRKLILLYTGATLLLSLTLTLVDHFLDHAISGTSGLSGLGARSVLSTLQFCLTLCQLLLLPVWQAGYQWVTLRFARREEAQPRDLLFGFPRFWPLLRLLLLQGLLYAALALAASCLGSSLFLMTPFAQPILEATQQFMNASGAEADALYAAVLEKNTLPLTICAIVLFFLLAVPFFYRFRLATYSLLEHPDQGALRAMGESRKRMQGNCLHLLKLDLSFWWFYLLDGLVAVVCYGDVLLNAAGISLPISDTAAFFLFFAISLVMQLGLAIWKQNQVSTTYAVFYTGLSSSQSSQNLPNKTQSWVQ